MSGSQAIDFAVGWDIEQEQDCQFARKTGREGGLAGQNIDWGVDWKLDQDIEQRIGWEIDLGPGWAVHLGFGC